MIVAEDAYEVAEPTIDSHVVKPIFYSCGGRTVQKPA